MIKYIVGMYINKILMGGVDNINRLKLNRTKVIILYSLCFYIQTNHINTCVREE